MDFGETSEMRPISSWHEVRDGRRIGMALILGTMRKNEMRQYVLTNAGLWLVAMLVYPVANVLPTSSGEPPKIFSLLIPLFFLMLGAVSTLLVSRAYANSQRNG